MCNPISSLNSLVIELSTYLLCSIVLFSHLVDSIFVIKKEKNYWAKSIKIL